MKKKLKILIVDDNQYYKFGLSHLLANFYLTKNTCVKFIDEKDSKPSIDILFHANCHRVPGAYYRYLHIKAKPLFFSILDKNEKCHVRKDHLLYRHQSIDLVLNMVEQARSIHLHSSVPVSDSSLGQTFTHRELEVLGHILQGRNLTEAAHYMHLSVKTVSKYKCSIMKKLNFRRNNELLYWMIQGGLNERVVGVGAKLK